MEFYSKKKRRGKEKEEDPRSTIVHHPSESAHQHSYISRSWLRSVRGVVSTRRREKGKGNRVECQIFRLQGHAHPLPGRAQQRLLREISEEREKGVTK